MSEDKQLDPRQTKFLELYLDPKSATFSNALQSALKAGYAQEYAESITAKMPDWLSENVRRVRMLSRAEKNLDNILTMDSEDDTKLLSIKADTSKFITSRLGKKFYSDRSELTGKDGEPLDIKWQK